MVSVAMECEAARVIPTVLRALQSTGNEKHALTVGALLDLTSCIKDIGMILDRMGERCDPTVFYHEIRPLLAGSKNMACAGLPRGVFYDEGNGKGTWLQLRGGSNGQSSIIQFFDLVLGVQHAASGNSAPEKSERDENRPEVSFHEEVREYMPGPHRRFLEYVTRLGNFRSLVAEADSSTMEGIDVNSAYHLATRTLADFRNKHLAIVTRYIIIPSRQSYRKAQGSNKSNLATVSSRIQEIGDSVEPEQRELTGTGGTALLPFLKQSRDETLQAGSMVG